MNKIISVLLPFYENKKVTKILRSKLNDLNDSGEFDIIEDKSSINIDILKEKYSETIAIKDKLEDKAKLNVIGITIAVTLIMGSTGLLNNISNKYNQFLIEWIVFALFSVSVVYLFIAGIMAIKVLIDENEIYVVQLKNVINTPEFLNDDYIRCITKNRTKNLLRNNSVYTSYECIRNALVCLFILLILSTLPVHFESNIGKTSDKDVILTDIYYSASLVSNTNFDDLKQSIEETISSAKNKNELVADGLFGLINSDGRVFIKISIKDKAITVLSIESIEKIIQ
ncbi:hypothetical protein [Anaerosolibacter sp.]|uniref:hypothetical protein n=1 Tax=Anaerosolibacter sp. TaxID=1872527 RepID=UPI0039F0F5F5